MKVVEDLADLDFLVVAELWVVQIDLHQNIEVAEAAVQDGQVAETAEQIAVTAEMELADIELAAVDDFEAELDESIAETAEIVETAESAQVELAELEVETEAVWVYRTIVHLGLLQQLPAPQLAEMVVQVEQMEQVEQVQLQVQVRVGVIVQILAGFLQVYQYLGHLQVGWQLEVVDLLSMTLIVFLANFVC